MDYSHQQSAAEYELSEFLQNAPKLFREGERIKKYQLRNGDYIHCVLWYNHFYITGTDIVKILVWRFQNSNRQLGNMKKFEEGIFSDLRNLKPGMDASLEGPRSDFLEFLYKSGCIRTQKKQKVFYWYSVPHQDLFDDAVDRDRRRDNSLCNYNGYPPERRHPFPELAQNKFILNQRMPGAPFFAPVSFEIGKAKDHAPDMKSELFNLKPSQVPDFRGNSQQTPIEPLRERKQMMNDFSFDNLFAAPQPKATATFKPEDFEDESKLNKINYEVGNLFKERFKDPVFPQMSTLFDTTWPLNLANAPSGSDARQPINTNKQNKKQSEEGLKLDFLSSEPAETNDPFDFKNFSNK